jgi:hypothetical protein
MSAAAPEKSTYVSIVSDLHRVGGGYSVQFITEHTDDGSPYIRCEWSPTRPSLRNQRRKVDMKRYDHALAQFIQAVADALVSEAGEGVLQ